MGSSLEIETNPVLLVSLYEKETVCKHRDTPGDAMWWQRQKLKDAAASQKTSLINSQQWKPVGDKERFQPESPKKHTGTISLDFCHPKQW